MHNIIVSSVLLVSRFDAKQWHEPEIPLQSDSPVWHSVQDVSRAGQSDRRVQVDSNPSKVNH